MKQYGRNLSTQPEASEYSEHLALMDWIKLHPILKDLVIHIPNEGIRTRNYGAKLRRLGMRSGVSDLFIPYPTSKYHGLWIELKRKNNRDRPVAQVEWVNRMLKFGYYADFALGWEHAAGIIEKYLKNEI